jgi:hypothetical protein
LNAQNEIFSLEGKTALIAGASSGIGRHSAWTHSSLWRLRPDHPEQDGGGGLTLATTRRFREHFFHHFGQAGQSDIAPYPAIQNPGRRSVTIGYCWEIRPEMAVQNGERAPPLL